MNIYDQRIYILSRIFTVSLSVLISGFLATLFYTVIWSWIKHLFPNIPLFIDGLFWISFPVLLSVISIVITTYLDYRFYNIEHNNRLKFYLLSWILFGGLAAVSLFDLPGFVYLMPALTMITVILLFQLYKLPENMKRKIAA